MRLREQQVAGRNTKDIKDTVGQWNVGGYLYSCWGIKVLDYGDKVIFFSFSFYILINATSGKRWAVVDKKYLYDIEQKKIMILAAHILEVKQNNLF